MSFLADTSPTSEPSTVGAASPSAHPPVAHDTDTPPETYIDGRDANGRPAIPPELTPEEMDEVGW
jgi:hypothetical protein